MGDPRHRLGLDAEALVAAWLTDAGWRLLARRWRDPAGELDLVMSDPAGVLVGIEVRARRSGRTGSAAESVGPGRVRRLRGALAAYARQAHAAPAGVRAELVTLDAVAPATWRIRRLRLDDW